MREKERQLGELKYLLGQITLKTVTAYNTAPTKIRKQPTSPKNKGGPRSYLDERSTVKSCYIKQEQNSMFVQISVRSFTVKHPALHVQKMLSWQSC